MTAITSGRVTIPAWRVVRAAWFRNRMTLTVLLAAFAVAAGLDAVRGRAHALLADRAPYPAVHNPGERRRFRVRPGSGLGTVQLEPSRRTTSSSRCWASRRAGDIRGGPVAHPGVRDRLLPVHVDPGREPVPLAGRDPVATARGGGRRSGGQRPGLRPVVPRGSVAAEQPAVRRSVGVERVSAHPAHVHRFRACRVRHRRLRGRADPTHGPRDGCHRGRDRHRRLPRRYPPPDLADHLAPSDCASRVRQLSRLHHPAAATCCAAG